MKKRIIGFVIGFILSSAGLCAAGGDLTVNGNIRTADDYQQRLFLGRWSTGIPYSYIAPSATSSGIKINNAAITAELVTIQNNGNVGIGTSSPAQKLDIAGDVALSGKHAFRSSDSWLRLNQDGVFTSGVHTPYLLTSGSLNIGGLGGYGNPGSGNVWIAGSVGIGGAPSYRLHLATDSAAKPGTSVWTIWSDSRLKTDVQPYTKGLKEILQINPVSYKYNGKGGIGHRKVISKDPATGQDVETDVEDTELLSKTNVGVIAQDIQLVLPETVSSHKGKLNENDAVETDLLDFNSHAVTFILINAVKELRAEIDSLNREIADLKARVK